MNMTPSQYVDYFCTFADFIATQGDYITRLDSATGDGDHWININTGYRKIKDMREQLQAEADFTSLFKKLARNIMSIMGGTSGALYGSMYMASAKRLAGASVITQSEFSTMLSDWAESVARLGETKPGEKTMLDSLYPASVAFALAMEQGKPEAQCLEEMKKASVDGAEATKQMAACKGRASTRPERGIGDLDPGAVTMSMQLSCLADYISGHCL